MMDSIKGAGVRAGLVGGVATTVVMLGLFISGASATPADPVGDAFTNIQGKAVTYGGATVALVVAVVVIFFGIKMLKKGTSNV